MPDDRVKVFISYSHSDLGWAEKLANDLRPQGFDPYFDRASLRAGQDWQSQLLESLQGCEHLILLWSKAAKGSDWVTIHELGFFNAGRYNGTQRVGGRLLVQVALDDTPLPFPDDQGITDVFEANAYAGGETAVPAQVWEQVVNRIAEGLSETSVPVSRAVVTVTKDCVVGQGEAGKNVDFDLVPFGGSSLDQHLKAMNVSRAQLAAYYGGTRDLWRPFGGNLTIREILEQVKNQLNSVPGGTPIRWVPVDDALLSDDLKKVEGATRRLASGLSLIVFDPVALYSQWLRGMLQYLEECLNNPHAIVVVLPLFPPASEPRTHTLMVRQIFKRLVDQFYEELPTVEHAQCSILTADDADIRRLVRAALRQFSGGTRPGPANAFLGGRRR